MTESASAKARNMEELNVDELVRDVVEEGKSELRGQCSISARSTLS